MTARRSARAGARASARLITTGPPGHEEHLEPARVQLEPLGAVPPDELRVPQQPALERRRVALSPRAKRDPRALVRAKIALQAIVDVSVRMRIARIGLGLEQRVEVEPHAGVEADDAVALL